MNDFTERGFSERRLILRQYKKYSIRKKIMFLTEIKPLERYNGTVMKGGIG